MGRSDGKTVPLYPPLKEVHLELHWNDKGPGLKQFRNVQELAAFLKANPILAEAVGYVAKGNGR
jgi:hypothetical protein